MKSFLLQEQQAFLRYDDLAGKNPTCVYFPGLQGGTYATFASVVALHPALTAHRSLFVEPLGFGFSDKPEDFSYSLEDQANTVALLLDDLDLRGCYFIGFSGGGAVAITLAATRPDLVTRLVLMEANLDPLGHGEGLLSSGIAEQTEEGFCSDGYQALIGSLYQAAKEGDEILASLAGILQGAAPYALYRSAVSLVQGTRPTMRERLLQMNIPRAYIFGEQSLPNPDWGALASAGIQVLSVPNAGHGMALENPSGLALAFSSAFSG
jgi:pimeloyl-ACP methyl ester carboxylesterase